MEDTGWVISVGVDFLSGALNKFGQSKSCQSSAVSLISLTRSNSSILPQFSQSVPGVWVSGSFISHFVSAG